MAWAAVNIRTCQRIEWRAPCVFCLPACMLCCMSHVTIFGMLQHLVHVLSPSALCPMTDAPISLHWHRWPACPWPAAAWPQQPLCL
jgi:hypothetical protein